MSYKIEIHLFKNLTEEDIDFIESQEFEKMEDVEEFIYDSDYDRYDIIYSIVEY